LFGLQKHALNRGAGTIQQGNVTVIAGAVKERTFRTSRCDRECLAIKSPVFDPGGKFDQVIGTDVAAWPSSRRRAYGY
jgi:hypothetical protein